jgi:hypothetical protein
VPESEDHMPKETAGVAKEATATSSEMTQPVIVNLGKQKSMDIKDLKEGEGKLWDEVLDVVDEVKDMLGKDAEGKVLVPIVMIYQERSRRRRLELDKILFPLLDDDDEEDEEDED